jgi:hypothetical protein
MTLGAAEILGVEDRLGSVEAGKIANLTLVRGDLFGRDRFIPQVIVDGRVFEIKEPARPAGGRGTGTGQTAAQPTPAVANVAGNYSITVDIPGEGQQPLRATLNFTQTGSTLNGNLVSSLGTSPVREGVVTATGFTFVTTVQLGGQAVEVKVSGTVTGSDITGTMESPIGAAPFRGNKTP